MPDLLLELFSEEIPARMQAQAAADLKKLVTEALVGSGLLYEGAKAFATPRRLALHVAGLPVRQADAREERKGPRVGSSDQAIHGFLKAAGLSSIDQARIDKDPKKGEFYVAVLEKPGRATIEVLAAALPKIIRDFPWPKSMRWGAASTRSEALRWVRPLHGIVCTFGPETEEPVVVSFDIDGIASGNVTHGHRFMAPEPITVRRFDDYVAQLEKAKVVLDAERRRDIIAHDARDLALAQNLELVDDDALLHEVAGLVEWPVVLMGAFEPRFLDIPPEVIRATIRANQKCFVLRDVASGKLAEKFILVANIEASDGGVAIAAGNARVVRARLSDAKFFWDSDLKVRLEDRLPKLDWIVFHEKIGTQGERIERITALARGLAEPVGADPDKADRAARLAKADLVSEMVGEFPELQGLMGRYYAAAQGEDAAVAAAIEDHYRPQGPGDRVPCDPVAIAVALADKLDSLIEFWLIDEKPTGSKDPYALRRAALGVIRIVLENELRLPLFRTAFADSMLQPESGAAVEIEPTALAEQFGPGTAAGDDLEAAFEPEGADALAPVLLDEFADDAGDMTPARPQPIVADPVVARAPLRSDPVAADLLGFFADRLKVYLRDKGASHDLIDAVFALPGQDDLLMIVRRVEALAGFLDTDDGKNLLAGYRRAANILRAEEKKDGVGAFDTPHAAETLTLAEEKALAASLGDASRDAEAAIRREDFSGAMRALSLLRAPVDAFFDRVTVNADDPALRINRLRLLSSLRRAMHTVADFSRIGGG